MCWSTTMLPEAPGPVAAIDCGTNSTRLLIVGVDGTVLERHMRITRLGEGVDATHELSPRAITRTVEVLGDYRRLMDTHHVLRARLVATSATRDAINAEDFFSAARRVVGLRPELLSGEEEGRLSFIGATACLGSEYRAAGPLLVVDIGGGSTELVTGEVGVAGDDVVAVSLDIGCVRVTERFLVHDPPLHEELVDARTFVDDALASARVELLRLAPGGVVGLAGTVSTVVALEKRLDRYDREAVHHAVLTRAQVEDWLSRLSTEDRTARLARRGMVGGREDVIVGGVLILAAVMDVFDRSFCLASEDDILDGLAASVNAAQPS
jgi:exopolyphosphatase/guanosine-5'-triphosphate,3'-diphosphate pyrophosphatase